MAVNTRITPMSKKSVILRPTVSASLSWCQAPIWDPRPIFPFLSFCTDNSRFFCCSAPSLTRRWICNLLVQFFLGLARAATLGSGSHRTHGHILLPQLRLPDLVRSGSGPHIYIPHLYPRALGSLFVAFFDSQG
jgi:hypothetical protein